MSTIRQKFTSGIGGVLFVSENLITANSASIINDDLELSHDFNRDFPIYAENDSSGNLKMIAVEFERDVDVCQFLDKDGTVVFDAIAALGTSFLEAKQSYIFPGNAPLTITEFDDIKEVRLRKDGTVDATMYVKIAIAYDVDRLDTIV